MEKLFHLIKKKPLINLSFQVNEKQYSIKYHLQLN